MAFVNERDENGNRRTVDYSRGLILICTGRGHPDKPYIFELVYSGKKIEFYAECRLKQTPEKNQKITWDITDIITSEPVDQIKKIIQEALCEYGFTGRKDHIDSVDVSFSKFHI